MIEVNGLTFIVGTDTTLRGIDLIIPEGGITALIGPNGAGKSSLLHCLAGLITPSNGNVRIGSLDPFKASGPERARAVALLQQSPTVVSRLRVRELVAFGRWPHHHGRETPKDKEIVAKTLAAFSLEELAERHLETLSGGQRQRAFIAMAWAQNTPWLLLDEPLNALDPKHARDLMARLHDLSRPEGRSVVIVLHDINAAAGWADRVVAMKDGRIVTHDASAVVLRPDILAQVFETQFEVLMHRGRPVVVTR